MTGAQMLRSIIAQRATLLAAHPSYEYATTRGECKAWTPQPPEGEGWERNVDAGNEGRWRFYDHEEAYWRRPLRPLVAEHAAVDEGEASLREVEARLAGGFLVEEC